MKGWLSLLAFACLACKPAGAEVDAEPALRLLPCRVRGVSKIAECGTFEVAENPDEPEGRKIALRVVRLKARDADERLPDPLFLLAGGPGQAASEAYGPMLPALSRINRRRDIVMVDQRGTGASAPLDCDTPEGLADNLVDGVLAKVAKRCRTELDADLTQYTTARAAADLDAVRAALGYGSINLFGASYGTRLALEYVRRHESSVRSVVIDGVAPRAMKIPVTMAEDGQRAVDMIFEACSKDDACKHAFGDLKGRFDALVASLPRSIRVRDPRTGEKAEVELTRALFTGALRGLLYSPELTSLLPLTIQNAHGGDFQSFIAQATVLGESASEMMSLGLFLSVICVEDVDHITEAEVVAATRGTFLGRSMVDELRDACEGWPRAALDEDFADPVSSDRPVLALSGELDPVTPPRWAEAAVKHLSTSRHLVVSGAAHGTLMRGCTAKLVAEFVDEPGSVGDIDATCLEDAALDKPRFFIDFAGPPH